MYGYTPDQMRSLTIPQFDYWSRFAVSVLRAKNVEIPT